MLRWGVALAIGAVVVAVAIPSAQATFSGPAGAENGRIYYVVGSFPSATIMSACPATGGHVKPVVSGASYPMPSPDGEKIAYLKFSASGNDGVWVADADGSNPVEIVNESKSPSGPSWSPDGTKLTFRQYVFYAEISTSVLQPVVVDVATKSVTPLLSDRHVQSNSAQNARNGWSPGGTHVYFSAHRDTSGEDLYSVSAGGGTATRIMGTDAELPAFQHIDIAPDGSSMLVQQQVSFYEDDGVTFNPLSETRRSPIGGGGGPLMGSIRMSSGIGDEGFSNSPDGTRVVLHRSPGRQLMTADADGADPVALGGLSGSYPAWSVNVDDCTDPGAATMRVNEVKLGDDQFVELLDPADETFPTAQAPYKLVVFDSAGAKVGSQTISSTLLQNRDNTQPLLLRAGDGDEGLAVTLPAPGHACFTKGAGEQKVDCVSWGCVATSVSGASTRIPAPGAGQSSQRQGIGSTAFHLAAPTPRAANVAGVAAAPCGPLAPGGDPGAAGTAGSGGPAGSGAPAPKPALKIKGGSTLTTKGASVSLTMTCAAGAACKGKATLTIAQSGKRKPPKRVTIGSGAIKIAPGKSARIAIKLNKVGKRLLTKKGRKVKARLTVALTGGTPIAKALTLRRS